MLERAAVHGFTGRSVPGEGRRLYARSSVGSRRVGGIEPASPATRPDLTRPCGSSAE